MSAATAPRRLYWRLAAGLLVAAGAYGWYVTAKYGRLNDLNQRQLAKAASELKSSIQNAVETVTRFKTTTTLTTDLLRFDQDQPYLSLASRGCDWAPNQFLEAEVTPALTVLARASSRSQNKSAPGQCELTFEFQTSALLRELPFPESFGLIFIANHRGEVLYQDAPSKQLWLNHLRWGERHFRDSGASRHESLTLRELERVFGDDKISGWARLQSMSGRTTLRLGGQFHEVYLEPLTIANRGQQVRLLLGGAVPAEAVVRRALAVDSYFHATIVFLLLIALLGFPFVKLVALDARERFGLGDVMGLYLSTAALLALATLTIQAFDASTSWKYIADRGLARLAEELENAFLTEIASIRRQADAFDETVSSWSGDLTSRPLSMNWYGSAKPPDLPVPEGPMQIIQASWIAVDTGRQAWKITADANTSRQNVSQRVYFQSVRDGYLFECGNSSICGRATRPFYIGPERSVTDGKFYTFMAMPSRRKFKAMPPRRKNGDDGYVLSVTARLFSLSTPALPAGYGFAIINRAGRVLYHSDSRLSLREHLFEELSAGERARAVVYSGLATDITSAYRESPHRLHFRPVALQLADDKRRAGLYVVTFRDISIERALAGRAFLMTLSVTMIVFLLLIGTALAVMSRVSVSRGQHWSAWLWPHGGVEHVYKEISVALSAVLAVTLVARSGGLREAWFVTVPLLAIALAIGIFTLRTRSATLRRRLDSPIWHSAMFVLLLICIIVVPASAVFRAVMGSEFGKLIAIEREWMEALHTDLPAALKTEMRQEGRPASMIERMVGTRVETLSHLSKPIPFLANPEPAPRALLAPFRWADEVLPIENEAAARVRYGGESSSYMPTAPRLFLSGWALLGLISTLALLTWWMRWKAIRFFFADQDTRPPQNMTPALLWGQCNRDERLVLIRVAREHVGNPYQRSIIDSLIKRGLLTLNPDLQPCSPEFANFIVAEQGRLQAELDQWEAVDSGHSWRYIRLVLLTSTAGLGLFVIATQPGVQASLVGLAGGIAGVFTAALSLRNSVVQWMERHSAA